VVKRFSMDILAATRMFAEIVLAKFWMASKAEPAKFGNDCFRVHGVIKGSRPSTPAFINPFVCPCVYSLRHH
jgi:hypothetical protein